MPSKRSCIASLNINESRPYLFTQARSHRWGRSGAVPLEIFVPPQILLFPGKFVLMYINNKDHAP